RYAVHGAWREQIRTEWGYPMPAGVRYFVADLLEKRSGHVWSSGAHKVQIEKLAGTTRAQTGQPRSRTFYGESAWRDAARYVEDYDWWLKRRELDQINGRL